MLQIIQIFSEKPPKASPAWEVFLYPILPSLEVSSPLKTYPRIPSTPNYPAPCNQITLCGVG